MGLVRCFVAFLSHTNPHMLTMTSKPEFFNNPHILHRLVFKTSFKKRKFSPYFLYNINKKKKKSVVELDLLIHSLTIAALSFFQN